MTVGELKGVFSRGGGQHPSFDTWSHSRATGGNETDNSRSAEPAVASPGQDGDYYPPPRTNQEEHVPVQEYAARQETPTDDSDRPRYHAWDKDENFPITEILRIKKKTKKIRNKRDNNAESIFREEDFDQERMQAFEGVPANGTCGTGGETTTTPSSTGNGQSARRKENKRTWSSDISTRDSLAEVLDRAETTTQEGTETTPDSTSDNARAAQQSLLQGFHRRGKPNSQEEEDSEDAKLNISNPTTEDTHLSNESRDGIDSENLTLHDLCGEATSTDDIAWRNALYLLSVQPHLAAVSDEGWTPLHICCLGSSPPPSFMVRALLYCYRAAAREVDDGGRLPLHLVAASSGDVETMQLLIEEYPQGIYQQDAHGLTPLHLLIRNLGVELTVDAGKVLLGLTLPQEVKLEQQRQKHILQRRGEHLNLSLEELEQMMHRTRPVTTLNRDASHEAEFEEYPADVQVSLRKLALWKRGQREQQQVEESVEAVELEFASGAKGETNPAAIPTPNGMQLPIHMVVQRGIVEKAALERSATFENYNHDTEVDKEISSESESGNDDAEVDKEISSVSIHPSIQNVPEVLRLFAAAYPEGLVFRDAQGVTPLLTAMRVEDSLPSLDIVETLLGKRSAGYEGLPLWAQDMPLHRITGTPKYMNPAMVPSEDTGQLPLHVAAEELLSDYSLIQSIHESYPGAIHIQDNRGRTPLHLALRNYRRIPVDPQIISLLFSDRVAQIRDDMGKLPFDLLLESATTLPPKRPDSWSDADRALDSSEASTVYQRFFNASILGSAKPNTPHEAHEFLLRLRALPPWLRKEACATSFIQELLIEELSSPWKCALITLDGLLLIVCITVFRLQMKEFVDALSAGTILSSWYTYAVYVTAIVRLIMQASFLWYVSASQGLLRHLCLSSGWWWIDAVAMLLSIITSGMLYGNSEENTLLALGTVTTGLLWLSLLGFLSNWCYGMALFTGGLSKIVARLVFPLIGAGMLLVAFAQMFFTLLQIRCSDDFGSVGICTVRDAYRIVYMLFRGDPLVDVEGTDQMPAEAIILVAFFLLFFVIFVIGLLLIILISAAQLDFEEIALRSFWEPKLAFILSSSDLGGCQGYPSASRTNSFYSKLAQVWDFLVTAVIGGDTSKQTNWYASSEPSPILAVPLFFAAAVIIPVWIAVGLATFGLFWPPQFRRWIFRPKGRSEKQLSAKSSGERSASQVSDMRNEIMQLKVMSYERSGNVEKELRDLKELLYTAMKEE